jgi:K+-sensing histidine kinase KdpD
MQNDNTDRIFFLSAGPAAAIVLGIALVPLRGFTSASNLSFAFVALTIVVAEYGGRRAAVATALCSALSLDFFLTQPYLRLTIVDKHDIMAFLGLGVCGLIAAALGSQRGERTASLRSAVRQLDLVNTAIDGLRSSEPLQSRLGKILDAMCVACPVAVAVIRDEQGHILAATKDAQAASARVPVEILAPRTLLVRGGEDDQRLPFPAEGARLALVAGNRQIGWLDLWGNGSPANAHMRRSLADAACIAALQLPGTSRS